MGDDGIPSLYGMMCWTTEFSLVEALGTTALFHGREARIDAKEQDMTKNVEPESKKPGFWDKSPLSPPWTVAAVFVLVVFFTVMVVNSLSA